MYAKVILANHERGLYAAHIRTQDKIAVFELVDGPPLRIGDIIRGIFSYAGEGEITTAGDSTTQRITIIKTSVSPIAATICLYGMVETD